MSGDVPEVTPRPWLAPLLIVTLVTLAYAPSLGGGFLGFDDDWLIENNPVMHDASAAAPYAILFDTSRETRLVLGAEYLPVRDLASWSFVRIAGTSAPGLRVIMLALYVLAVLAWRAWLRRLLGEGLAAEIATLAFALHPVHVESVAWLAGLKDVLALLFTGLALAIYAADSRAARRRALVVVCVLLACFSKAASVVLPVLLWLADVWMRRRSDRVTLAASSAVAVLAAAVHANIGGRVGMYAAMPGGSRLDALATMAPVALRYALRVVFVEPASIVYEVPDRTWLDPLAILSAALLALALALAIMVARRGERRPLLLLAFAAVALAPVSQVLAPIQHRMADRYLFVAIIAPSIALGLAVASLERPRARQAASVLVTVVLLVATSSRALTFAIPTSLWLETTARAPSSPVGPYQLAVAVEQERPDLAESGYREAVLRDGMTTPAGCSAANNLAILLARSSRVSEAITLLESAHARFPSDPHVGNNLAVLLYDRGEHERARQLLLQVMQSSPRYLPARESYRARWGEPPLAAPSAPRYDAGERAL